VPVAEALNALDWHVGCTIVCDREEDDMPSRYAGSKRKNTKDQEIPAELSRREAQDRSGRGEMKSPVDAMHVDAPKKQDNARGHKQAKQR
jgi:hypothetical protein